MNLTYFTLSEFDSPDEPGSGIYMDVGTLQKLDIARGYAGIPFRITSGYRTHAHNQKVGGVPNSAHTQGRAADIAHDNRKATIARITVALARAGFERIGVSRSFVHADDDPSKPCPAFWDYTSADHVS